jgi:hypothetical protein
MTAYRNNDIEDPETGEYPEALLLRLQQRWPGLSVDKRIRIIEDD